MRGTTTVAPVPTGTTGIGPAVYDDTEAWVDLWSDSWGWTDLRRWGAVPVGDLTMTRGDTVTLTCTLTDAEFADGDEVRWTAKRSIEDLDSAAVISRSGDQVTVDGATATVTINPADTVDLDPVVLRWDWQVTTATGDVYTLDAGTLTVRPDVTRSS